jgi:hypothetical protein
MAVDTTPIDVGTVAGDGTGDPARVGGITINDNIANLDSAVELIQSGGWTQQNTSTNIFKGVSYIADSHAGITYTLPAVDGSYYADSVNDILVINTDTNSSIDIDPDGTEEMYVNGASLGAGVAYSLAPGFGCILLENLAGTGWHVLPLQMLGASLENNEDIGDATPTAGNVLVADGTDWDSSSKEDADIVERSVPALESTPYVIHESLGARASGTETIDCATQPSTYLRITGNNVTIHLDTPALSLPVRGLSEVMLSGYVMVKTSGNYSGLTVTTDAGSKLGTFPKGTAPSTTNEWAILAWRWFDDGTDDFMWAEWVNDQ